jgi:predicted small secreted protein
MKRTIALLSLAVLAMGLLSACNTVEGFGKDVQKVGEKMEGAAKD